MIFISIIIAVVIINDDPNKNKAFRVRFVYMSNNEMRYFEMCPPLR